jgi:hypothetical protein
MRIKAKCFLGALAITLAWSASVPARAQAPDPSGCTPQERSTQALQKSDALNAGVLCPPDVDPAMKAPTPKTDDRSVVPPPGDPTVQPK